MNSADLRFRFSLMPVEDIEPWSRDGKPLLHWYGLSGGWYWLEIDGQELFRTADGQPAQPPYVEYNVARLWEDILQITPDVLTEVPADIALHLRDPDRWLAAVERIRAHDGLDEELVADGLDWWRTRCRDSWHLVAAPTLWLWRTGESLNLFWESSTEPAAAELWRPVGGFASQTLESFIAELRRFDREFLGAMRERVDTIVRRGGREGVDIDLEQLQREQHDRSTWLERALATPRSVDWDRARQLLEASRRARLL
jgi:hypothetical protein